MSKRFLDRYHRTTIWRVYRPIRTSRSHCKSSGSSAKYKTEVWLASNCYDSFMIDQLKTWRLSKAIENSILCCVVECRHVSTNVWWQLFGTFEISRAMTESKLQGIDRIKVCYSKVTFKDMYVFQMLVCLMNRFILLCDYSVIWGTRYRKPNSSEICSVKMKIGPVGSRVGLV